MGLQHFVVGIENHRRTDDAVRCALDLGRRFDARVEVVHAVEIDKPPWWDGDDRDWMRRRTGLIETARFAIGKRLDRLLDESDWKGRPAEHLLQVVPGRPSQALRSFATKRESALLVLGGHRDHNLFDFGCTMREIIGDAPCPVWVQTRPLAEVHRILVPVDLSPSTSVVLDRARSLATRFGARIHLLNCFDPPEFAYSPEDALPYDVEEYRSRQHAAFQILVASPQLTGIPHTTEFADGEVSEVVLARAEEADLIVMGTHGHSAMAQLTLGSQAYRVLRRAELPVLVVPQGRARSVEQGMTEDG